MRGLVGIVLEHDPTQPVQIASLIYSETRKMLFIFKEYYNFLQKLIYKLKVISTSNKMYDNSMNQENKNRTLDSSTKDYTGLN